MDKRIFVKLDRSSISASNMSTITECEFFEEVEPDQDIFRMRIPSTLLDHAALLLSENPDRYGHDLSDYLASARLFLERTAKNAYLVMPGVADHKRRCPESLGVAIASIFMVQTLHVKWETVSQIPNNEKATKLTPDFVAFDDDGGKWVYEAKGTTRSDTIEAVREKAKRELNDHREASVGKFAIVTYISTSAKLMPSFAFVSDPPIPLPRHNPGLATALHFLKVLEFAGLDELMLSFLECVQAIMLIEKQRQGDTDTYKSRTTLAASRERTERLLEPLFLRRDLFDFKDGRFVGRWIEAQDFGKTVRVFLGVDVQYLSDNLTKLMEGPRASVPFAPRSFMEESQLCNDDGPFFSLISDGTLFLIEGLETQSE